MGEGSGEYAPILVFPLDCVGDVFSSLQCRVLEVDADAKVSDGEIKQ